MSEIEKPDRIYQMLMAIRKRPQLYIGERDIKKLRTFVDGFFMGCDSATREWNCLTGFNDYCSKYYHDTSSFDWSSFILAHEKDKDHIDVFYTLLDRYLEERQAKGFPLTPPPHYVLGGLYKTQLKGSDKTLLWMPLFYHRGEYLTASMVFERLDNSIVKDKTFSQEKCFYLAWIRLEWIPVPEESVLLNSFFLTGDYHALVMREYPEELFAQTEDNSFFFRECIDVEKEDSLFSVAELTNADFLNGKSIKYINPMWRYMMNESLTRH